MPKTKKTAKEIKRLPIVFQIDLHKFAESGELPKEIQVLPVGKWNHPAYGPIVITREDISQFKANFDKGLRKDIPITEGHESFQEKPAVGWFVELIDKGGNGLYATVEWTKEGKTLLSEKSYKYFSPEFYSEYEDPETRDIYENVLVGGALTNKPYFKELEAVVLSEQIIKSNKLNFNDMDLQAILAKKVEDLSTEEKTFLVENKEKLNEDQLSTFGSVFEDEKKEDEKEEEKEDEKIEENKEDEKEDEKTEDEKKEDEKEEEKEEEKTEDEKEDEKVEASEFKTDDKGNVIMSMAEAKVLHSKANAGYEASEKLRKAEIETNCNKLVFSEKNSKGKFLPKSEQKVFSFMLGLTEAQRKTFAELVESIPANKSIFTEQGSGHAVEGSAFTEIESKAKKLMSEDKELKYSDAISKICKENKDLADRYQKEL